jgi:hypothetical protein
MMAVQNVCVRHFMKFDSQRKTFISEDAKHFEVLSNELLVNLMNVDEITFGFQRVFIDDSNQFDCYTINMWKFVYRESGKTLEIQQSIACREQQQFLSYKNHIMQN